MLYAPCLHMYLYKVCRMEFKVVPIMYKNRTETWLIRNVAVCYTGLYKYLRVDFLKVDLTMDQGYFP